MKKKLLKNYWTYISFGAFFAIILVNRSFPYFLHGPFGFGYDTGIYKKTFEDMTSLYNLAHSQIDLLPSLLAYIFNLIGIPLEFLLYHFYIFASAFIAVPLYLLTKEYFGKKEAILAIAIFGVGYVQILASQFFLYKSIIGAVFMLFAFFYYARKSYLFYLFLFLLAITELPQLLLLIVGISFAAIFSGKKYLKFHLIGLSILIFSTLIILLLSPERLYDAINVVVSSLQGITRPDSHYTGLLITPEAYLNRAIFILMLGIGGVILSFIKRITKTTPLRTSLIFVSLIVFFKLFFENRFTVELDLFLIPFVAYFIINFIKNPLKKTSLTIAGTLILIIASIFLSFQYYKTTFPALSPHEVWAIDVLKEEKDSNYVMVTNTIYAPWIYGFSGKTALAPGIFESVWDFETWVKYNDATDAEKTKMLLSISEKYGKFYLFMGFRQSHPEFEKYTDRAKKIFDVQNTTIYKFSP